MRGSTVTDQNSNIIAVILTKNEEINIERSIRSVGFCKHVIVLDSGSTDQTASIAESLGATVKVNIQAPPFNIANQRNWILDNFPFSGEWVLFLDADEEVRPELRDRLLDISKDFSGPDHYQLTPRYMFLGRWLKRTIGFPNWHARFLRFGTTRFAGGVWEHFSSKADSGYISEPYDHYAYSKGLSDWLARHDRYSTWDAERIVAFQLSGDTQDLGTTRKVRVRAFAAKFWPLRPFARALHAYVLRGGFVEGWQSLVFCTLYFFYEFMTVVKIIELKRRAKGLPL